MTQSRTDVMQGNTAEKRFDRTVSGVNRTGAESLNNGPNTGISTAISGAEKTTGSIESEKYVQNTAENQENKATVYETEDDGLEIWEQSTPYHTDSNIYDNQTYHIPVAASHGKTEETSESSPYSIKAVNESMETDSFTEQASNTIAKPEMIKKDGSSRKKSDSKDELSDILHSKTASSKYQTKVSAADAESEKVSAVSLYKVKQSQTRRLKEVKRDAIVSADEEAAVLSKVGKKTGKVKLKKNQESPKKENTDYYDSEVLIKRKKLRRSARLEDSDSELSFQEGLMLRKEKKESSPGKQLFSVKESRWKP